jgi:hypothetical protein
MDEIDWEALLEQLPPIVVLDDEAARKLSMQHHPSRPHPAWLSAALN